MPEIGAYDARTRLPELLRRVRKGERFTITHRGRPVAELVPIGDTAASSRLQAIESLRNLKRVRGVPAKVIAGWIGEGRR